VQEEPGKWVPKSAFVMLELPASLNIDPLLAALIHAFAFLDLSEDEAVDPDAAVEALENMQFYLERLKPKQIEKLRDQLESIRKYAESQNWPSEFNELLAEIVPERDEDEE
jgi:hypothetical protein